MAQGVARRVCIKHVHPHVITCLSVCCFLVLSSSSVSRASTFSLTSTCSLSRTSTSMLSRAPSTKPNAHPQNEEYCPVAIHNPLTCLPAQPPLSARQRFNRQNALTSCMMLLPPPLSLTSVRAFLVSSWPSPTGGLKCKTVCNVHIFDVLHLATAVHIFIKTDSAWAQIPQHDRPLPDLWATIARLLARRQPHSAPSLHTAWTIQQIVTEDFRILEVLNYELTTPTPATWIEVFKHRLSLWEELRTSTGVPPVHSAGTNHRVR